jgi:hypothetical protein
MEYALHDLSPHHFGPRRVQALTDTINDVSFVKPYYAAFSNPTRNLG